MKDDKRRIPYNIWINVLGAVFFSLIAICGLFLINIAANADQRAVETREDKCDDWGCGLSYTYSDIETISNWQDYLCRTIMILMGIAVVILGFVVWVKYVDNHYWYKGEHSRSK